MADVSKAVSDRIAITRVLTSAIAVHGAAVAPVLEAILFPNGAPANCDVRVFLTALGDCAQSTVDDVASKDRLHAIELTDDTEPREERELARGLLRASVIGIRDTLEGAYGVGTATTYGLSGETPTDADTLLQSATATEELLRTRTLVNAPLQPGVSIDLKAMAAGLKLRIDALAEPLGDVRREEREAQLTRNDRNEALSGWNEKYQGIADALTGLFELAGQRALADRVRPTARRRAGLPEEADTDTDSDTTPTGTDPKG
jgi:hypothetical protein